MIDGTSHLYGTYVRDGSNSLHCVATGQRLLVHKIKTSKIRCEYTDDDISVTFTIKLQSKDNYYGSVALVDWTRGINSYVQPRQGPGYFVNEKYGAWRRLTWFLLDAILVWLIEEKHPCQAVLLLGGWFNGIWTDKGRFQSNGGRSPTYRQSTLIGLFDYPICPLDMKAPKWHYERGQDGAQEGRVAFYGDGIEVPVIADTGVPISEQLSNVPRFIGDDGTILFFHRVVPHSGPEYSPSIDYGLITSDYGFYFSAAHGFLRGLPFQLRDTPDLKQPVIKAEQFDPVDQSRIRYLHPALREQQLFASAEANALRFDMQDEQFPEMRSLEYDQPMRFGYHLGQISEAPLSIGLSARLMTWPRLTTEIDDRIKGFFAGLGEARRARMEREFLAFRMRLLSGKVPKDEIDRILAWKTRRK